MIYLQITRWVQKDNNPNIWWKSLAELKETLSTGTEHEIEIVNYLMAFSSIQSEAASSVERYLREKGSDNNIYTCRVFDSLDKVEEFNSIKNTENFLNFIQERNTLLLLWNIEMSVSQLISLDINSIEDLSSPDFLMNQFNEYNG